MSNKARMFRRSLGGYKMSEVEAFVKATTEERLLCEKQYQENIEQLSRQCQTLENDLNVEKNENSKLSQRIVDEKAMELLLNQRMDALGQRYEECQDQAEAQKTALEAELRHWKQRALKAEQEVGRLTQNRMRNWHRGRLVKSERSDK